MASQELVRLSIYFRRNPNITDEEFHKHWTEVHAPLVGEWLTRNGILRYVQHHIPSSTRSKTCETLLQYTMEHIPNGTELREFLDAMVLPFDGVCELWMRSLDDYMKARDDPLYKEKIEPDIMYFTDFASLKMAVGKETLVIEDGKALPTNTWKG